MSMTSTDVHELIAESTLDSDAAMIDAITRPTMPAGNVSDMKYGRILSVAKSGGSGGALKNPKQPKAAKRQRKHPDRAPRRVDDERLPRVLERLRRLQPL